MAPPVQVPETHVSGQSNTPISQPAHALSFEQVAEELRADILNGLSEAEASQRLAQYGNNELGDAEGVQPLKIILAQVANAMTMVSVCLRLFSSLASLGFCCMSIIDFASCRRGRETVG